MHTSNKAHAVPIDNDNRSDDRGSRAVAMFEVVLKDGATERIEGADTYDQEGPLTTFFRTADDRRVIDCWSERLESIRTADIVRIRRSADAATDAGWNVTELRAS
jgi:hypothetical protein